MTEEERNRLLRPELNLDGEAGDFTSSSDEDDVFVARNR